MWPLHAADYNNIIIAWKRNVFQRQRMSGEDAAYTDKSHVRRNVGSMGACYVTQIR